MREVKYMRILVVVLLVALGVFAGYTVGRDHIISPPVTVSPPAIAVCPNTFERVSILLNTLRNRWGGPAGGSRATHSS
jgi:hypothetical protein